MISPVNSSVFERKSLYIGNFWSIFLSWLFDFDLVRELLQVNASSSLTSDYIE